MNTTISGVVDSFYTKEIQTKRGPGKVHHAVVVDNGTRYDINLGFKKPTFKEGQLMSFEVTEKYNEWHVVQARSGGGAPATTATPQPQSRAAPVAFPVAKDSKDMSIVRQNSLTHATRIVDDWINHSGDRGPGTLEEYTEVVLSVAYTLTDFSTGHRELKMANEIMNQSLVAQAQQNDD